MLAYRNRLRVLPPPHQARNLIGFLQAVHAAAEPILVAVLAGTEVLAGAYPNSAQGLAAKQAGSRIHFTGNCRVFIPKLLECMAGVF
jgi:hypothetical protein